MTNIYDAAAMVRTAMAGAPAHLDPDEITVVEIWTTSPFALAFACKEAHTDGATLHIYDAVKRWAIDTKNNVNMRTDMTGPRLAPLTVLVLGAETSVIIRPWDGATDPALTGGW